MGVGVKGFLRGGRESSGDAESNEPSQKREQEVGEGMSAADFTDDELREFLEADQLGVRADPAFKERLRRRLWEIVLAREAADNDDPGEDGR
jgi:hypothetical protein